MTEALNHTEKLLEQNRSTYARPQSVHGLPTTCVVFRPTPARRRPSWRPHRSWRYPHACLGPAGAQKPRRRAQQLGLPAPPRCPGNYSPPDTTCRDRFTCNKYAKHTPAWEKQAAGNPTARRRASQRAGTPSLHKNAGTPQLLRCPPAISNFNSWAIFPAAGRDCCTDRILTLH